ncbi:MAG: hypothetical protein JWO31_2877 [Phycisphaerales bacterium]|nr:hypothetical protein [Phycisphaerales bacterium]
MTYATPVGTAVFAHVAPVAGAELGYAVDPDGNGFVIAAALPAAAFPRLPPPAGGLRTFVNFEATLGGHNKFWWANRDGSASRETFDEPTEARLYPGSWAPAEFKGLDGGVVVQNWMTCGPFGGPGVERFNWDGGPDKAETRRFFDAARYPPDGEGVNPAAPYAGPQLQGYWPKVSEARWKPAAIADLDTRLTFGTGAQLWYAATWVHAPQDVTVDCAFRTSRMAEVGFWLNGERVDTGTFAAAAGEAGVLRADKPLRLRQGWNEIRLRGYCYGYPPLRAGLTLLGPADALWTLRLSGRPPASAPGKR